ncbi:MAG TPA: enoyl-CoA hydratase-related protein [Anaeromyxobacteraceae bacterium]|nr:enoyl-CoA hydratase-related protein [Anaeromyxobacteraceae bacterium]
MQLENLLWRVEDGVGIVTFNRPKVLNAMNARTFVDLEQLLDAVERDATVRALVFTGAGDKAFVAGADIAAMAQMGPVEARRFAETAHRLIERLERLPIPTIAAVNGFALGGGCEFAMGCDIIYASEKARFGQPEVNLGLTPGFGGSQRLTRRVGIMRALEMVLTGDHYDAARAKEMGLALEVLPQDQLLPHAIAQAKKIASKGPVAVAVAKRLVQAGADADLTVANELERQAFAGLFGSEDAKEGMRAFVEKRAANWKGN